MYEVSAAKPSSPLFYGWGMGLKDALVLDARLGEIYQLVGKVRFVADIGADHGFLGVRLLLDERCERVQFLDISGLSLKKAYKLAKRMSVFDRCDFSVGDGAAALLYAPDAVVIAGMGGETIARILKCGREALRGARLIMQPNVDAPLLREALEDEGFLIVDERIVRAKDRHYVIICAQAGEMSLSRSERIAGPVLLKTRGATFLSYARFRLRVAQKAYQGARGKKQDVEDAFFEEIALWKGVLGDEGDGS